MKPFQIVLLAVFGILALIGLYVFATFSSTGGGTSVGKVTIWGVLPAAPIESALTRLGSGNSNYKGVTYVQKNAANLDNELAQAIATGAGPDLVLASQEQLITSQNKFAIVPYASLPKRTFLDSYASIFDLYLTTTGTYGIPLAVDPLVLYYNTNLLQAAGVATPPATWEELPGMVPLLTKQTDAQTIQQSTIAFGGYGNVSNARAILSALLFQAGSSITGIIGGNSLGSTLTQGAVSSQTTLAAAAVRFYTQFADPAKTVYSWNQALPVSEQYFLANTLALYPGFASEATILSAGNPNLRFDVAPFPQTGTGGVKATYGLAYAFALTKTSTNATGAFSVATLLTDATQSPLIAKGYSLTPALISLLKPDPADPYAAVTYPAALTARGWLSPSPATVDAIFAAMITNVTSGRDTISQALIAADQSLTAALQGN